MSTSILQKIFTNLTPMAPRPIMIGIIMHDRRVSQLLLKDTRGDASCVENTRVISRRTKRCRGGRAGAKWDKYMVRPWEVEWTPECTYRPVLPRVFPDPYPVEPVLS